MATEGSTRCCLGGGGAGGGSTLDLVYVPAVNAPFEASTGTTAVDVALDPTTVTLTVDGHPVFGNSSLTASVEPVNTELGVP